MRAYLSLAVVISMICGCATRNHGQNVVGYSPPIIIALQSIQVTNTCHVASFEMKNVGDVDLWFTGNKRGEADYFVQRELSIGGWRRCLWLET